MTEAKFVVGDEPKKPEPMFPLVRDIVPKSKKHTMRVYQNVPVTLTYQNFGSTWLGILRGSTQDIEAVANGLFNLKATNGDCQFFDHAETVGMFWTDRRAMRRFFFNQYFLKRCDGNGAWSNGKLARYAMRYAKSKIEELRKYCHESFMDFSIMFQPVEHGLGRISDERPDSDFKDAVLSFAFRDRE